MKIDRLGMACSRGDECHHVGAGAEDKHEAEVNGKGPPHPARRGQLTGKPTDWVIHGDLVFTVQRDLWKLGVEVQYD